MKSQKKKVGKFVVGKICSGIVDLRQKKKKISKEKYCF
jgi:hypothetical protein